LKSPTPTSSTKRIITVGGGKGGVGKSIVSSNLAVAMAQAGLRVVLVDCDLGAANQHVLFGIDRPVAGLQSLIDRKVDELDEALTPTALPTLHLVAGTGAAVGAANITHGEKQRIMKKIRSLTADVVIVDVGAGVSFNVLDFFELGSQRLLVVTPQVTSIQTAYSFLKGAVLRTLRHHAEKESELDLLDPALTSKENEKVSRLLARVREENPAFGEAVTRILSRFGAQIVGNQVSEPNQAGIFHAVSRMIHDFLGISVPILGYVGISRRIRESINQRRPMMLGNQIDENTKVFQQMAEALLLEDVPLDDLLIEEEDEPAKPPAKPAKTMKRPVNEAPLSLEMTPAPRHPEQMAAAAPAPAAPPPSATATMTAASEAGEAGPAATPATPATTGDVPAAIPPAASGPTATPHPAAPGVDPDAINEAAINADLQRYARKHERYAVDWMASLRNDSVVAAIRVFDISAASVAIECNEGFEIGQQLTLVFDQLPQRPTVNATVMRSIPRGFVLEGDVPSAVIFSAKASRPAGARLAG
jgi:flagellar biosynthesis protein FlhG